MTKKTKEIKPRNMVAVAAKFRSGAGVIDSSKKSAKAEKKTLKKEMDEGKEDAGQK